MPHDAPAPKLLTVGALGSAQGHRIDLDAATFAVVDLETSGRSPNRDRIVELAVARVTARGEVLSRYTTLLNPAGPVGPTDIHRIDTAMVSHAPFFGEVAGAVLDELRDAVVVAHNATFESGFLSAELARLGVGAHGVPALCTLRTARAARLGVDNHRLATVCAHFGIDLRAAHTAMGDVEATAQLLAALLEHHRDTHGNLTFTVDVPPSPLPHLPTTAAPYPRTSARTGAAPRRPRVVVSSARSLVRLPAEAQPTAAPAPAPSSATAPARSRPAAPAHYPAAQTPPPPAAGLTGRRRAKGTARATVVELRAAGAFGHRHPRAWSTTYTPIGGSHPDSWPDQTDTDTARALSHAAVATCGVASAASEELRWWAAATVRFLQRGHLPPVPAAAAAAAGLEACATAPAEVLAQLPAAFTLDGRIELHPRFERPFWDELCRRHPHLARWCVPQASLDALAEPDDADAGDRFVDFVLATPWAPPLVVELDGAQHDAAAGVDAERDAALNAAGVDVHRCAGGDVDDPTSRLWARIDALAAARPTGTPTAGELRGTLGPAQLHRFAYAVVTAAEAGWLTPGGDWDLEVHDDLDVIDDEAAAPLMELLAALSDIWDLDVAPTSFSLGGRRWHRDGHRYRPHVDDRYAPAVVVHLEALTPAHAPHPAAGALPAVCIRGSIPAGVHQWRTHRRPPRRPTRDRARLDAALHTVADATFGHRLRGAQLDAVVRLLDGDDLVVLLPTGAGKSVVYQLTGLLTGGSTIVVDPINALIDDQVRRLGELGVDRAVGISSSRQRDPAERAAATAEFGSGDAIFTFCSPERIGIAEFRDRIADVAAAGGVGLLVVDEAHCVSEWGHDFRSSYLRIGDLLRRHSLNPDTAAAPPLVALTGTASPAVLRDVLRELDIGDADAVLRPGGFDRPNLRYGVDRRGGDRTDRLRRLLTETIPATLDLTADELFDGTGTHAGIVFVPHVNGPHGIAAVRREVIAALGAAGLSARVGTYSGGRPRGTSGADWEQRRAETAAAFVAGDLDVLVATKSFGMGVDNDAVRWTIHIGYPASIEAYAQEAGRAGRDATLPAACHLLVSDPEPGAGTGPGEDLERQLFFHRRSFPGPSVEANTALALWAELRAAAARTGGTGPVKVPFGGGDVQLRHRALHRLLTVGVVVDYTVGYGSRELTVRLRDLDVTELDERFLEWANRVEPGRSNARRAALRRAPAHLEDRIRHHICAAVDVVYSVIEPARRHALREMRNLALTANSDAEIRERIAAYLSDGPLAAALRHIVERDDLDVAAALRELSAVDAAGAAEWFGAATRQLEGAATHPVLHAARSLAEALTDSGERAVFDRHVATMLAELGRYGASDADAAALVEWLMVQLRNRDGGRRWSWTETLWALWHRSGRPSAPLERQARRVLAEAAQGNSNPAEALAVLAVRLDGICELVDTWCATADGEAHAA